MSPPSPTSSEEGYWAEDDESWLAAVPPSILGAGSLDPPNLSSIKEAVEELTQMDSSMERTEVVAPAALADPFLNRSDDSTAAFSVTLARAHPPSESEALQKLLNLSSEVEHSLDSISLSEALSDETYVDNALEVAFNDLGDIKGEMHAFYHHTPLQARLVVCYGTITDIIYQEEMIYIKLQDTTGECVLRIIRTHDEVEPRIQDGTLPGISIGVSISALAMLIVNHSYGGHSVMLATPVSPSVVESTAIGQHVRYAEVFRDFTIRVRSERRTKFILSVLCEFASLLNLTSVDTWSQEVPKAQLDQALLDCVIHVLKSTLERVRVGRPAAGCPAAHVCRVALAELAKTAVVNCQYISVAIEQGLLVGWVTEDVTEPNLLLWTYIVA